MGRGGNGHYRSPGHTVLTISYYHRTGHSVSPDTPFRARRDRNRCERIGVTHQVSPAVRALERAVLLPNEENVATLERYGGHPCRIRQYVVCCCGQQILTVNVVS